MSETTLIWLLSKVNRTRRDNHVLEGVILAKDFHVFHYYPEVTVSVHFFFQLLAVEYSGIEYYFMSVVGGFLLVDRILNEY